MKQKTYTIKITTSIERPEALIIDILQHAKQFQAVLDASCEEWDENFDRVYAEYKLVYDFLKQNKEKQK
jgi:hypothetical protein